MLSESVVVMLGFIMLHIAVIMNLVATASNTWVRGHVPDSPLEDATEGLWVYCDDMECTKIQGEYSGWFITVVVLYMTGVSLSLLATALYYIFCMSHSGYRSKALITLIVCLVNLSVVLLVIALAVYGAHGTEDVPHLAPPRRLAWSYFVGLGGLIFSGLAGILTVWEMVIIVGRRMAYIDL